MSDVIKTLTSAECDQLLHLLDPVRQVPAYRRKIALRRLLVLLFLDAGLRLQEALQFRIFDLLWGNEPLKVIVVRSDIAKGHQTREIPTSLRLSEAILFATVHCWSDFKASQGDFAFSQVLGGKPYSSRSVQYWLKAAGRQLFRKNVTPHMLRHTFATRLMSKCSIRVVQTLLGHKSLSSTQVYTHPNSNDLSEAINSI